MNMRIVAHFFTVDGAISQHVTGAKMGNGGGGFSIFGKEVDRLPTIYDLITL